MNNKILLGYTEVDITPTYSVQTVGFNRKDNYSRGVLHKLYAQISIWTSNHEKCCLIAIDSIGFSCDESNILRDEIAKQLKITREKVMICFTHTHSAPNISLEPKYFSLLREQVILGVIEAEKNKFPVKVAWGAVEADIGLNRRDKNGVLDKRVGILKIVNAETDTLQLLLLRVTAHSNVLQRDNYYISSDFIGVTRQLLKEKYNCKVMITQGASGNIKPKYTGSNDALTKMASEIYEAISFSIDNLKPQEIEHLLMLSENMTFISDVPNIERAKQIAVEAMNESKIDGTKWLTEVARLNSENIIHQSADIEMQYFVINNGCICGVPNEIMCELAVEVAKECNNELIFFGAYTNGCDGYLPTANEYDKGGYEVLHSYLIYYIYFGRVMPLNRSTAGELVGMVSKFFKG